MKSLIYKDIKGATEADDHFRESGHFIEHTVRSTAQNSHWEIIDEYKCKSCNFRSYAGSLYQVWDYTGKAE